MVSIWQIGCDVMMQTSTDIVPPSPPITDFHVPLLEFYLPTTILLIIIISAVVIAFRERRCCPSFWAIISVAIVLLFYLWEILYGAVFGPIYDATILLIITISAVVIAFREKRCCPSFWAIISAEIILLFCLWGILYLAVFGLNYEVKLFREGIEMTIGYVNFCYLCAGLALAVVLLILKVTETRIIRRLCVSKT